MGSRFQFQLMSEDEARAVLAMQTDQGELFNDKVRAVRRMTPVTTPAEREETHAFNVAFAAWRAGNGPLPRPEPRALPPAKPIPAARPKPPAATRGRGRR